MSSKKLKLIFLDFDGVIRTKRSIINRKSFPDGADSDCVAQLNRIISATKAKIVFSTSWRPRANRGLSKLNRLISSWGVTAKGIGYTPTLQASRGQEIAYWLWKKGLELADVDIVILDDEDDMFPLKEYLIQCDFDYGLTKDLADQAINWLAGSRVTI